MMGACGCPNGGVIFTGLFFVLSFQSSFHFVLGFFCLGGD